jgi:ABC-type multidrug transport system ATPase subunit
MLASQPPQVLRTRRPRRRRRGFQSNRGRWWAARLAARQSDRRDDCRPHQPRQRRWRWRGAPRRHTDTKRLIGLVPRISRSDELSAAANLRLFGALYGLGGRELEDAIGSALLLVGLTERARDRVKTFSGGMKRRLNLAAGLLHDPAILLLDEPTVGVDPQSRHAIFENLEHLKRRGKALLYTTHYMEEAERMADRIVVMDHGRVVADDTLADSASGRGTTRARRLARDVVPVAHRPTLRD